MGLALDLLERGVRLVLHLDVEDLDAVEAHRRGLVDAVRDAQPLAAELPERIGRDADRVPPSGRGRGRASAGFDEASCVAPACAGVQPARPTAAPSPIPLRKPRRSPPGRRSSPRSSLMIAIPGVWPEIRVAPRHDMLSAVERAVPFDR